MNHMRRRVLRSNNGGRLCDFSTRFLKWLTLLDASSDWLTSLNFKIRGAGRTRMAGRIHRPQVEPVGAGIEMSDRQPQA